MKSGSKQTLSYAVKLASESKAAIHILHVVDNRINDDHIHGMDETIIGIKLLDAKENLDNLISLVDTKDVEIIKALNIGRPSKQISTYSKERNIDLVLLPSLDAQKKDGILGEVQEYFLKQKTFDVVYVDQNGELMEHLNIPHP